MGVELFQLDGDGNHYVIAFPSRSLVASEKNYTITEKEALSIVFACKKLRTYLVGNKKIIRLDHQGLTFLKNL